MGSVAVLGGKQKRVRLLAGQDVSYPLAQDEQISILLSGPGFAYAPVVAGEKAGVAYLCIGDTVVRKIPVVYEETVEMEETKKVPFWKRLLGGKT